MRSDRRSRAFRFLAAGAVLVLSALALVVWNLAQDRAAGLRAQAVTEQLILQMPEPVPAFLPRASAGDAGQAQSDEDLHPARMELTMPVLGVDGADYIGILSVPSLRLELPVAAAWSEEQLRTTLCVYAGSYFTDDLTLIGRNDRSLFSALPGLDIGETVKLTTVDGQVLSYLVSNRETLSDEDTEQRTGGIQDWDLSLVTWAVDGRTRCVLRCERVTG